MKVLVTGSSGFIGSHLLPRLARDQHELVASDIRDPGSLPPGTQFLRCDILDARAVERLFSDANADAVIHLAARTDLDEQRDVRGYNANIDGVRNVLRAVRNSTVTRGIYTSSQLVCHVGYTPKHDEDYAPTTRYGESKVLTEKIVREEDGGGKTWCLVRPTTVWGPGMRQHYVRFFRMIQQGRYFHVGRRHIKKPYGFVGNVVHQYAMLLRAPVEQIHRKTLYVADYAPLSLREWGDALQRALSAPPIRSCPEFVARVASRVGDAINAVGFRSFPFNSFRLANVLSESSFDLSETEKVCGPLPYTTEDGVKQTAAWLRSIERTDG